jgi:signal transduction histidine kinase
MARWAAALVGVFGVATELFATPRLVGLDAAAGYALVGFGLACWARDRGAVGPLLVVTGSMWFMGNWFTSAAYLHRGPLVQLLVTYPTARLWPSRRWERAAVLAAYAYAVVYPLADSSPVSLVVAALVVVTAAGRLARAHGPDARSRRTALGAAGLFGVALALTSVASLAEWTEGETVLAFYDVSVLTVAAVLGWGILSRQQEAAVLGLVVDLGEPSTRGVLRNRLAATIGDPTLGVGFWVPVLERYVDEFGRPIDIAHMEGRDVMAIDDSGVQVAILIHDPGALDDPQLRSAVASATRLAVVNARLQAEIAERVSEIEASQRRIVRAADEQGRRLELELRRGPLRRLETVAELASGVDEALRHQAETVQAELQGLAHGIRPAALTEHGLAAALSELARDAPIPLDLEVTPARFAPVIEAAAYFVCTEGLANVAKHARASRASIKINTARGRLDIAVGDDGVGGAEWPSGSGLRGLADRVEALGGRLTLTSPRDRGTRLAASIPINPPSPTDDSPTRPNSR